MDRLSKCVNDGKKVGGLSLDITNPFYTVNHGILLDKLHNCGVREIEFNWFKNYLEKKLQYVKVNWLVSGVGEIKQGVPQGSVLGAVLFLI